MANGMNGTPQQRKGAPARNGSGNPPKKADVIIQITRDISRKQEDVRNQTQLINSRLESVAEVSNQSRDNAQEAINRSDIVYNLITDSITALKHEITYLAAQSENIYLNLAEKLAELNNALDELSRVKEAASEKHEGVEETAKEQVDYDAIADKLAERLPRHDPDAQETAIDYDLLSDKIAEKIPAPVVTTSGGETPVVTVQPAEIDYDLLSDKIAGKMPAPVHQYSANTPVATAQPVGIDYDELSAKVVSMIPVQETISTDYIASKVAEQIVIPSSASDIDYDTLAKKVAECVGTSSNSAPAPVVVTSGGDVTVDYEYLADKVASKVASQNGEPAVLELDYEALAEKVADKIISEKPAEEPAVLELDYEALAEKVADKIISEKPAEEPAVLELDYEALAEKVADKIISEKPAEEPAVLELDYEALAEKVADKIISEKPAEEPAVLELDYDTLSDMVANKLSAQNESNAPIDIDYDLLADKVADRVNTESTAEPAAVEIDYDLLADKVADRVNTENTAEPTAVEIDYDLLADKVADRVNTENTAEPAAVEIDYDLLADKVADRVNTENTAEPAAVEIDYDLLADKVADRVNTENTAEPAAVEIDYDLLADKVADRVNTENTAEPAAVEIDYDLLADKVADRVNTENTAEPAAVEIDYEVLADKVADRIISEMPAQTANGEIDLDALADKVAERVPAAQQVQTIAAALPSSPVEVNIDEDELADKIALKVGAIKSDDFDIIVDEDGCESISKAITEKIDYNIIAETVSEKIRTAIQPVNGNEPDYDEIANRIGDKIQVAGVNEDAIADKAAAALSGCLPEIDTDYIADKVANQVLEALSANNDVLADKVAGKVADSLPQNEDEEEEALRIELDYEDLAEKVAAHLNSSIPESAGKEESVTDKVEEKETVTAQAQISEEDLDKVADKITKVSGERFDSIDKDLEEIKSLLESGVKVSELAPAAAEQTIAEDSEEELVTVSDIVSETEEPSDEETFEEDVLDPKAQPSEDEESLEIGDELLEASDGVDFLNMMKYDRSFIARIIQGTDDQKVYYGRIKHALLSYKKVNSNIAWGAERFHKGRETIARLKIRGKTLILYLALDPAEFPYSVYHQKDVSNNKSLHGTPLAVKVMSPLGVKKAIRLIDAMLEKRDGIKKPVPERNYAEMYPYETIEELIADGLVHDVKKP